MRKKLILLTALTFVLLPSQAQTIRESVARKMNLAILNTLDEYERVASFAERQDESAFFLLFVDAGRACIYNDLIGRPLYQQTVSPTQYAGLVPKDGRSILNITLSDIEKTDEPYYEDGKMHRKISLTKNLMLIDAGSYREGSGGVLFDSQLLYKNEPDFRLTFDFVYDEGSNVCRINSITSKPKPHTAVDNERFTVLVQSHGKYEDQLTCDGEPVDFNSFEQAIVDYSKVDSNAPDVVIKKDIISESSRYEIATISLTPIRGRVKIKGSYMPAGAYAIESTYSNMNSSSRAAEATVDLGYSIPASNIFKLGLYLGAGVSFSSISMNTDNVAYSYDHILKDGSRIQKSYSFTAQEGISCMDFVFPAYLEGEFRILKKLYLNLDLGAKVYLNWKTKLNDYAVNGQFCGNKIDGIYSAFISPARYSRNLIDISLFGSLCLEYGFSKTACIFASAGYEYGLKPSYNGSMIYFDRKSAIYPFVYSENEKRDIAYRSLIGTTTYTRRGILVSLGFKFKF